MAISEAQRRANNKWAAKNTTVLGCKMRRDAADEFKAACKAAGTTPNAVFRRAVDEFMGAHGGAAGSQDTAAEHAREHPSP